MKNVKLINLETMQDLQLERMLQENWTRRALAEEEQEQLQMQEQNVSKRIRAARRWMFGAGCSIVLGLVYGFSGMPELAIFGMVAAAVMALEAERV